MTELIRIFFETSVVLGTAQDMLLETPEILTYVQRKYLEKPDRFFESRCLLEKINELQKRRTIDIEPFVSPKVKEEVRNLVMDHRAMNDRILKPLKIEEEIKKMNPVDLKLFEFLIYRIFIVKLPILTFQLIDQYSSRAVDDSECESIRDDVFFKVYQPLIPRFKYLYQKFVLAGLSKKEQREDFDFDEWEALCLILRSFKHPDTLNFKNYKKIVDLHILAEAIYSYRKMKKELGYAPDFYFVSNDTIFIPLITPTHRVRDETVPRPIEHFFEIKVVRPRDLLEILNNL